MDKIYENVIYRVYMFLRKIKTRIKKGVMILIVLGKIGMYCSSKDKWGEDASSNGIN